VAIGDVPNRTGVRSAGADRPCGEARHRALRGIGFAGRLAMSLAGES
jgi:hypothetical protein